MFPAGVVNSRQTGTGPTKIGSISAIGSTLPALGDPDAVGAVLQEGVLAALRG